MNTKGWLIVAGVLVVAAAIVLLWPTPDPLAGVQTVAIAGPDGQRPGLASQVFEGLEIALDEHNIKIVASPSEADAIVFIEPQAADIRIDDQGFRARVRCRVTREDGSQSEMDLYVIVDEQGLTAKLESRRFWEFWK
jgi:hypothetical protein